MSRFLPSAALATVLVLMMASSAAATFPDRNGLIAFAARTDDGIQLFTLRPNGRDLRQVTHVDGTATLTDWSPDGTQLAFTLNDCSVAFVDADGTNLTVLPPDNPDRLPGEDVCDGDPSFTPDAEHVVYTHYDAVLDKESIGIMRLDGTDRHVVTDVGGPDPNVSPDGTKISFKFGDGQLGVANIDGTGLVQVSPSIDVGFKSDWAPDGRHLAFSDYADPDPDQPVNIFTVRPDGTDLRAVTHFTDPGYHAYIGSYSPDGQWIVFRIDRDAPDLHALFRIRPDGTDMHRLTAWSSFRPRSNDWGPATRP